MPHLGHLRREGSINFQRVLSRAPVPIASVPVTKLRVILEKVPLVIRQVRLPLLTVGTLPDQNCRRSFVDLPRLHHFLVAGRSPMQDSLLSCGKIHRAKRTEVRSGLRHVVRLARLLVVRVVTGQLVALKRHQRSNYLRTQFAFDSLLIRVRRGQALVVAGLPEVQSKLQIVSKSTIAAAAGQRPLTTDHDRHRTVHH